MGEKRRFSRVRFSTTVEVEVGKLIIKGVASNISLKGLFMITDEKLPVGQRVDVTIRLENPEHPLSLLAAGRVVRVDRDGMGIDFEGIDLDAFAIIKEIVTYNLGDREKVQAELIRYIEGSEKRKKAEPDEDI